MTNPIAAAPIVPTIPWTEEAVPAIGAIFSIASVPRLEEVKAKLAIVSPWKTMNRGSDSKPARAIVECAAVITTIASAALWPTRRSPKRPTTRELRYEARAIGAATDAKTRPMYRPSWKVSNTIC